MNGKCVGTALFSTKDEVLALCGTAVFSTKDEVLARKKNQKKKQKIALFFHSMANCTFFSFAKIPPSEAFHSATLLGAVERGRALVSQVNPLGANGVRPATQRILRAHSVFVLEQIPCMKKLSAPSV